MKALEVKSLLKISKSPHRLGLEASRACAVSAGALKAPAAGESILTDYLAGAAAGAAAPSAGAAAAASPSAAAGAMISSSTG